MCGTALIARPSAAGHATLWGKIEQTVVLGDHVIIVDQPERLLGQHNIAGEIGVLSELDPENETGG